MIPSLETILEILAKKYNFDVNEAIYVLQEDKEAISVLQEDTVIKLDNDENNTHFEIEGNHTELRDSPYNILIACGDIEYKKENTDNLWNGKPFYNISTLKPNNVGNVGENFIKNACEHCNIDIVYDGTKNKDASDGTYDIKILGKRCEIKTARIGLSGSFQHESLRNEGCDYYGFVNILQEYAYITILPKWNLKDENDIMNVRSHLRKGSSNVFKYSFCERHLLKSLAKGHSIKIDKNTTLLHFETFISTVIV